MPAVGAGVSEDAKCYRKVGDSPRPKAKPGMRTEALLGIDRAHRG